MKKIMIATSLSIFVLSGCAHNSTSRSDNSNGFGSILKGLAHLVLSPIQITAGLLEGVASLPYYASTSLHELNKGLENAQAAITLDDTYESAYGSRLSEVPENGETNERFRRMKHASSYLQKILKSHGVANYESYYLASIDTANRQGVTLFSVVYREQKSISVIDKYNQKTQRHFQSSDRLFYEPFATDKNGSALDVIIDWAGVSIESYQTQKMQAVLLTLAANSIINGKRSEDYWIAEKRWINGEFSKVMQEQQSKTESSMLLKNSKPKNSTI